MKIRIKKRRGISLGDFPVNIALFCLISYAMLEHTSIPIPEFSALKIPILCVAGCCLLTKLDVLLNNWKKKRYFYILAIVALLCVILMISAYVNRNTFAGNNAMRSTIRLVMYLVELFVLMIWISENEKFNYVIQFLFCYVLILTIITDGLLFTGLVRFGSGKYERYLVGTKFSVSYLHMNLVTLWLIHSYVRQQRSRKTKFVFYLLMLLDSVVSIRVNCMSGVLGCFILLVLYLMIDTPLQRQLLRFTSPQLLFLFLLGSLVIPMLLGQLVRIPFITRFIEEILGRDLSLTGRLVVYNLYSDRFQEFWLLGVGFGNGNMAAERLFRVANAQNALVQWVLQTGVPATCLLITFMLMIFARINRAPKQKYIMPLVVLIYTYIVLGVVETTFNMSFLMWMALLFAYGSEKEAESKKLSSI